MKILKRFGFVLLLIIGVVYFSFLFVLPNVINLNNYKSDITNMVKEMADLDLSIDNIKLKTTWDMQVKILLENASIKYSNKKELLSATKAQAGIKILPLCLLNLELSPINIDEAKLKLAIEKDGRYDIEKYANNLLKKIQQTTQVQNNNQQQPLPIKISNNMPNIVLNNYVISLKDEKTNDILKINGDVFKITDFRLGDKINLLTNGSLNINEKKYVGYNVKVDSFLPKIVATNQEKTSEPIISMNMRQ